MMRTEELRHFPRISLKSPLRLQVRGSPDFDNSISENISLNGIGLTNDTFIAPLTTVMLEIKLLSRVLRPIAKIVWSQPAAHSDRFHLGAEFLEFDSQEKKLLSDFINMKLNKP